MAVAPMVVVPIAKLVSAMSTIQPDFSRIDLAARAQTRLFAVYVFVLVVGGLLAALFTVLVWRAGNRYQDAVKTEADARIAEAGDSAAQANDSAAMANERAEKLENENLKLRSQLAGLEKQAADASAEAGRANERAGKIEQQNLALRSDLNEAGREVASLQKEAASARERQAIAERNLLELQERLKPRHLTDEQRAQLVQLLKANPKGEISIACINGNVDSCDFAKQIADVLSFSGWTVAGPQDMVLFGPNPRPPVGLFIIVQRGDAVPVRAIVLQQALQQIGFTAPAEVKSDLSDGAVHLLVGAKP